MDTINDIKILLLCSSRFALPSMRDMIFGKKLALVGIPGQCEELIEEVTILLTGTGIPVLKLEINNFEEQLNNAVNEYEINLGFVLTFTYKISSSLYNS